MLSLVLEISIFKVSAQQVSDVIAFCPVSLPSTVVALNSWKFVTKHNSRGVFKLLALCDIKELTSSDLFLKHRENSCSLECGLSFT